MDNVIYINNPNQSNYGEADFTCSMMQGGYQNNFSQWVQAPESFFIVRDDDGTAFKPVGKDYQLVQHPEAFKTADKIISQSGLDTTDMTKEFKTSHDGARAYGFYTFPQHREAVAVGDEIELQLLVRNSIDGSMRFAIEYGAIRLVCLNGMTALGSIGKFKRKHTKYLNIHDAVEPLTNVIDVYHSSIETWKKWTGHKVTDAEAIKYIADAVATPEIKKHVNSMIDNHPFNGDVEYLLWDRQFSRAYQLKDVWGEYKKYRKDLGSTMWAVYNSLTHWATHYDAYKESSQANIEAIKNDRRAAISKTADNILLKAVA